MANNKQQTAVEWLESQLLKQKSILKNHFEEGKWNDDRCDEIDNCLLFIQQAKEMEKEQKIKNITDYNIMVTEFLLNPLFNLEHSKHGIACEKLSDIRNQFISDYIVNYNETYGGDNNGEITTMGGDNNIPDTNTSTTGNISDNIWGGDTSSTTGNISDTWGGYRLNVNGNRTEDYNRIAVEKQIWNNTVNWDIMNKHTRANDEEQTPYNVKTNVVTSGKTDDGTIAVIEITIDIKQR